MEDINEKNEINDVNEVPSAPLVDTGELFKKVATVAGPALLITPLAMPVIHGLSGIAVLGAGALLAGTTIVKTVTALSRHPKPRDIENDPDLF
ncbi:MAG: hypothetical protein HGA70_03910 [Chlorobiaceae bacterium]|nr:hypothetical protein [Chlorobiaceae bacterium]NTW11624.1 hypothetical protein [Chlorobiaceae bacterium]